ncbi:MAG: DUF7657 domain-containing protein [Thermoleophilia bacterium]
MNQSLQALRKSLDGAGEKISEKQLIRFDYRVFLLIFILALMFVLAVAFRIHGSSMGAWDTFQPGGREEKTGIILGSAKAIRSDEWMVSTPWTLSQSRLGYPLKNENVGANNDPLFTNIPVRHFTTIFRPQNWGYFGLGVERGFAFMWNFKIFGVLISFFFLLMLLTRNHFWLSLVGSIWVLFSGFTQWWFSTPLPETIISFALAFIGFTYLFLALKKPLVAAGAALLVIFSLNFVLFFYPPFQVLIAWLAVFLAAGFLVTGGRWQIFRSRVRTRLPIAAGGVFFITVVLYFFYQDAKGTIAAVSNTDYPGIRVVEGGDTGLVKMFSGFTGDPFSTKRPPLVLGNASEASNYIFLFPVVMIAWARNYLHNIKNDRKVSALLLFLLFISSWLLVRFPPRLAKISLLSFVPSSRALLGLGLASILVTIIYLAGKEREPMDASFARGAALSVFVLMIFYGFLFDQATDDWLRYRYVLLMALFYTAISYLLLMKKRTAFSLLILLVLAPYYLVNPIAYGLDPVYGNKIVIAASEIQKKEPDSKWIEYGGNTLANLLKTSGMNVVNGNKYTPDLEFYRTLDPGRENQFVYNRYSDVVFSEPKKDSGKEVEFVLIQGDSFAVLIDPCSEKLAELGVTNFAFAYKPAAEKVSCLELITGLEESNVWFFRRKM